MPEQTVPGLRYNWLPSEEKYGRAIERLEDELHALHASRALWIRSFHRLEKAVTNHIDGCIDSDGLAHVHKVVLRDLGPNGGGAS